MSDIDDTDPPDLSDPDLDAFIEAAEGSPEKVLAMVPVDTEKVREMQRAIWTFIDNAIIPAKPYYAELLLAFANLFAGTAGAWLQRCDAETFGPNREQVRHLLDVMQAYVDEQAPDSAALTDIVPKTFH